MSADLLSYDRNTLKSMKVLIPAPKYLDIGTTRQWVLLR
jgi:hypothetical protein